MRLGVAGAAILGVVGLAASAPRPQSVTASNSAAVLDLLHDGRFDAAEARTRPAAAGSDLEAVFLDAFVYYWRLLYDEDDAELQAAFERRLTRAIDLAGARLSRQPRDSEAALWGGTAHLLRGQLLARQKKTLAAAGEAKRSRRMLLQSGSPDALFGLGSYNYLADQLQGAARGLRALMGIPGGNREEGLRQLERAARQGEHLRLEARLLLMSFYAGKRERRLDEALRQAGLLVREHGRSVVALDAAARTELLAGRADQAAALLDRAVADGRGADASVTGTLRLWRARAEIARFRPDLALDWLDPLLARPAEVPGSLRKDVQEAAAVARAIPPESWQRIAPALRLEGEPGAEALATAAREHPDDAVVALFAGRALLLSGRAAEALPLLTRAEGSGRLPLPWVGPSRLLAGQAADLLGRRPQALAWYQKALDSPEWVGDQSPRRWLSRPYRGDASS